MTIIRDMPLDDGRAGCVLLSQVEHARLAGELAAAWGGANVPTLVPREAIVETVLHHDDGWRKWEQRPGVDPATCMPYLFTEMPNEAKFEIWSKSIDAARAIGPLPAAMVAWHFMELPKGTNRWQPMQADAAAREFIETYEALAAGWLDDWLAEDPASDEVTAQTALEWLQMFDVVSLWLCMADQREPRSFDLPGQGQIVMTPGAESKSIIVIDPWPLLSQQLRLEIAGRRVPVRHYRDAADLASEPGETVRVAWDFVPSG